MAEIDLTQHQAQAIAALAQREGAVALHQLGRDEHAGSTGDVYVTPHGSASGFRISVDGATTPIGETLPAAD